jgi:hypothetical protein
MNETTDSKKLPAALLGGISAPVTTMLTNLVLVPTASLSPDFLPIVAGGFITFVLSVYAFFGKKHGFVEGVWHIASMAFAGYVVVSWARYQSIMVSGGLALGLLVALIVGFYLSRSEITKHYGKQGKYLVAVSLVLVLIMPMATLFQNVGQPPEVNISPSSKFIQITEPGTSRIVNVSIVGIYANAWDLSLTSEAPTNMIATYLDGRENGPVEIPFLERGREVTVELTIETHPQISEGDYDVSINLQYSDGIGGTYEMSNFVNVMTGESPEPTPPPPADSFLFLRPTMLLTIIEIVGYYGYMLFLYWKKRL